MRKFIFHHFFDLMKRPLALSILLCPVSKFRYREEVFFRAKDGRLRSKTCTPYLSLKWRQNPSVLCDWLLSRLLNPCDKSSGKFSCILYTTYGFLSISFFFFNLFIFFALTIKCNLVDNIKI